MASPYKLKIVTPEKVFFDGETTQIIVRTTEGDLGVLANHTSLVASLKSGPLKIMQEDGKTWRTAAISIGLLKIGGNSVNILANAVEWADEIDIEWAKRSEADAREKLKASTDKHELDIAELKLQRALNRISVYNSLKK